MQLLKIIDKVNEWTGNALSMLMVPLVLIILIELTSRTIFNSPTIWVHETSGFILAAIALLGGGYVMLYKGHVNVDMLISRYSKRIQAIIALCCSPLVLFFLVVIILRSSAGAIESIHLNEHSWSTWAPIFWPIRLMVPIGAILLLLQVLVDIVRNIMFIRSPGNKTIVKEGVK